MNDIKNGKNSTNIIQNYSKQVKKNKNYKSLNNYIDNSNNLKITQNKINPEKHVQRNQSSISKKEDNIKSSINTNYNNTKANIRRKYKEKKINNSSQNKTSANKSINDSKQKTFKNTINRNESLNKIIMSGSKKKKINKIPSSLEKKVNSYIIPKIHNSIGINSKTQINRINHNLNLNQNYNNLYNNSNNSKYIDISSKKKHNQNNIINKYFLKYYHQKSHDNSFDNSKKVYKNKKIKEGNKYKYNNSKESKEEELNSLNNNHSNNKKIFNKSINYINYINNDNQKRNKTIIGKKEQISMINEPYNYNLNEYKNELSQKNTNIFKNGKLSFKNSVKYNNYNWKEENEREKEKANIKDLNENKSDLLQKKNSIFNNGKFSFQNNIKGNYINWKEENEREKKIEKEKKRKREKEKKREEKEYDDNRDLNENKNDLLQQNISIFNNGKLAFQNSIKGDYNNRIGKEENEREEEREKKRKKENDDNKEIIKKINNIIEQMKIDKKREFNNKYNSTNINCENSEIINKIKINNNQENEENLNKKNKLYKYEDFKINHNNNLDILEKNKLENNNNNANNKNIIIKNNGFEMERKNENENELENTKSKESQDINIGFNFINKYKNPSFNKIYLNNGQDNNINDKINNNKNSVISKMIGEQTIENEKKEELPNISKNQLNLLNNRVQNNEIIKINVKNLRGIYQNKKDLNKTKEIDKENLEKLITESLTGLVNLGETCYMNTGLQNIIHCIPFINQLFSVLNQFKDIIEEKPITNSFINLCNSLIKTEITYIKKFNINSFDPTNFRNIFCHYHKEYADHEQHDSLEFLRIFLDDISKELNQTKIIQKYKELKTEGKSKEEQNYEYNNFYLSRENSIIVKVFYSQIMNIFTCECGDISYSFEKILDIPLLFPKEMNSIDINLNDLLNNYFNGEKIVWSLACQKCGQKNLERNKTIKLSILPEVIIFSLLRFNPITGVKINKIIKFEETIDLQPFCDKDFFNGEINTKYKLFGISNHSGTLNFGHYYSYTKVGENWYEFNDSFVKPVNLNLMSRSAYFFFYEKIE